MNRLFRLLDVSKANEAVIARVRPEHLDEYELNALVDEFVLAGLQEGCRKLVISFGHKSLECLYSVFLAKLITVQRQLAAQNRVLVLSEVHPVILNVFHACNLDRYFLFATTVEAAVALDAPPPPLPGPCHNPHCEVDSPEKPANEPGPETRA